MGGGGDLWQRGEKAPPGPAVSERWGGARSAVGPSPGVEVTRGGAGRVGVSVRAAHGRFAGRTGPGGGGSGGQRVGPGRRFTYLRCFTGFGEAVFGICRTNPDICAAAALNFAISFVQKAHKAKSCWAN